MARVTIVIEDRLKDGVEGLRISCESDPDFPEIDEEQTVAQQWALDIMEMILDGVEDVRETNEDEEIDKSKLN